MHMPLRSISFLVINPRPAFFLGAGTLATP